MSVCMDVTLNIWEARHIMSVHEEIDDVPPHVRVIAIDAALFIVR